MSNTIIKKIQILEKKRLKTISNILVERKMVRGSFCEIHIKCGKNCRCNNGQGHTHKRMSLRENGKSFSRAVPREEYEWIQEMTDNYREYRALRRQLAKTDEEISSLLDQYESAIVERYKKGKAYLNVVDSEAKLKKSSEIGKTQDKEIRRK
jgi:hypothetical protein